MHHFTEKKLNTALLCKSMKNIAKSKLIRSSILHDFMSIRENSKFSTDFFLIFSFHQLF
jgi:hypothetical protein